MWSAGSERTPALVYLGSRRVAVATAGQPTWVASATGFEDALAQLAARRAEASRSWPSSCRIALSGGLCRPFMLVPPAGLDGPAEFEQLAAALAPQSTGLPGPCRVWVNANGKAAANGARVVVATEDQTLSRCSAVLGGRSGRGVASIRPWWALMLAGIDGAEGRSPPGMLGVRDDDSLVILRAEGDAITAATTFAPVHDDETARSIWIRQGGANADIAGQSLFVRLGFDGAEQARGTTIDPWGRIDT